MGAKELSACFFNTSNESVCAKADIAEMMMKKVVLIQCRFGKKVLNMNVLIIGAGAVGRVYGKRLAQGGAQVSFFVKEKYAEQARRGFDFGKDHWGEFGVLTRVEQVRASSWDQIYLTMSSTALRGSWWDELAPALGDATVVMLQPGAMDREYLETKIPKTRIVCGVITVVSFVNGNQTEAFFPPFAKGPFSGERAQTVVDALNRGGIRSVRVADVEKHASVANTAMGILFCAVDAAGWSLKHLANSPDLLTTAKQAAQQASHAVAVKIGQPYQVWDQLPLLIFSKLGILAFTFVAQRIFPFDLEKYLKLHFTKVGDQMRFGLKTYAELAEKQSLPNRAILKLLSQMQQT